MIPDPSIHERNRAATNRIHQIASLSDVEMQTPVGQHWTIAILLAHLAFWDRRVMYVLEKTEQDGKLYIPQIEVAVNDLLLPLWAAIPPKEAARLAIESAEALDQRLENYPPELLETIYTHNQRWVDRSLHRNEHLDEADEARRA